MPDNFRVTDNTDLAYSESSSRRCVLQNSMGELIDAGEFDPELLLDRRHVDRISRCIAQHQGGEALLHRISCFVKLDAQRLLGNIFDFEGLAADFFEPRNDLEWT